MSETDRSAGVILDIRLRLLRAAAWYQSAHTTFQILRLLDEETVLAPATSGSKPAFVAHPGFEV
jgi:hypothetical protein